MKKFILNNSIIIFLLIHSSASFCQNIPKNALRFDSSKSAIIEFNKKSVWGTWPFDSTYKPASLTQIDLENIDSILIESIKQYNNQLDDSNVNDSYKKFWHIDLSKRNYVKQLMVVLNKKGEKEVWINCMCFVDNNEWKNEVYIVNDGGNCFFNLKINLTTKKYFDFKVNGLA